VTPERKFTLRFYGRINFLKVIRDFVKEIVSLRGTDPITVHAIVSAVDEALANVIHHAYGGEPGEVTLTTKVDDTKLSIVIRHRGKGFDPASVPKPELNRLAAEGRKGGLGLAFMRQFMDEVEFRDLDDGQHECTLTKQLPPA